eukprot:1183019-Prorocentrum_minimum.AAC.1
MEEYVCLYDNASEEIPGEGYAYWLQAAGRELRKHRKHVQRASRMLCVLCKLQSFPLVLIDMLLVIVPNEWLRNKMVAQ